MALINRKTKIEPNMAADRVHEPTWKATYKKFKAADGKTYVQIDTYGSANRACKESSSQSIQIEIGLLKELFEL